MTEPAKPPQRAPAQQPQPQKAPATQQPQRAPQSQKAPSQPQKHAISKSPMLLIRKRKVATIAMVIALIGLVLGFGTSSLSTTAMVTAVQNESATCNVSLSTTTTGLADCTSRADDLDTALTGCNSSLGDCNSDLSRCAAKRDSYSSQLSSCQSDVSAAQSALQAAQTDFDSLASGYANLRCCQLRVLTGLDYDKYFIKANSAECCYSDGAAKVCTIAYADQPLVALDCS